MNTGFEVHSMLTVPLKTTSSWRNPAAQQRGSGGHQRPVRPERLVLLQEVAEYSATLMHRMLEPKFQLSAEDTAKFVARFSDLRW